MLGRFVVLILKGFMQNDCCLDVKKVKLLHLVRHYMKANVLFQTQISAFWVLFCWEVSWPVYENLLPPPFKIQVNLKQLLQLLLQSDAIETPHSHACLWGPLSPCTPLLSTALMAKRTKENPAECFLSKLHRESAAAREHKYQYTAHKHQNPSKNNISPPKTSASRGV